MTCICRQLDSLDDMWTESNIGNLCFLDVAWGALVDSRALNYYFLHDIESRRDVRHFVELDSLLALSNLLEGIDGRLRDLIHRAPPIPSVADGESYRHNNQVDKEGLRILQRLVKSLYHLAPKSGSRTYTRWLPAIQCFTAEKANSSMRMRSRQRILHNLSTKQ